MTDGPGIHFGDIKGDIMGSHDAQPPAKIRVLEVPDKTLWTAGGIRGRRVGPQSPVWGRPHPQAASGPPPGAAAGCFSEHPPWHGVGLGQDREKPLPHPGPPRRVQASRRGEARVTHGVMRSGAFKGVCTMGSGS